MAARKSEDGAEVDAVADEAAAPEVVETVEVVVAEADLEDAPADPDAVSIAPPRNHESLVSQFAMKWSEVKAFAVHLTGDLDGELGEVLALVRKHEG
jgi:hypothetical protein